MAFFNARPHFEDRQMVQRMGESINLSGQTNFELGGYNSYIYDSYEDFLNGVSGSTFLSLPFSAATNPFSGWSNQIIYQPGIFRVTPPHSVQFSGNTDIITSTTQEDVTNYILTSFDSVGTALWTPLSAITSMSGSCTPNFYVGSIHPCSSGGTVIIEGDLLVRGNTVSATTIIETETILVEDNNIELNYGGTHTTAIGGGITVLSGISNTQNSVIHTDTNGIWVLDPGMSSPSISATTFYGDGSNLTGISSLWSYGNVSNDSIVDGYGGHSQETSPKGIIAGGDGNTMSGSSGGAFMGGGVGNTMVNSDNGSFMIGGVDNTIHNNGIQTDWGGILGGRSNNLWGDIDYGIIVQSIFSNMYGVDHSGIYGGLSHLISGNTDNGNNGHAVMGGEANTILQSNVSDDYMTLLGGSDNTILDSGSATIIGGGSNTISGSWGAGIIQSVSSTINGPNDYYSVIIGGNGNSIGGGSTDSLIVGGVNNILNSVRRSVILGGTGITGTTDNTVFVDYLNVRTLGVGVSVNNLGVDSLGNVVTGSAGGGGVSEATTATTTTVHFTGQTIFHKYTNQATGNITEDLTGAKLGITQKIYHNDVVVPTFPAGWVLMGDGVYFTSELNLIFVEWAEGSRVEYWYVQEQ